MAEKFRPQQRIKSSRAGHHQLLIKVAAVELKRRVQIPKLFVDALSKSPVRNVADIYVAVGIFLKILHAENQIRVFNRINLAEHVRGRRHDKIIAAQEHDVFTARAVKTSVPRRRLAEFASRLQERDFFIRGNLSAKMFAAVGRSVVDYNQLVIPERLIEQPQKQKVQIGKIVVHVNDYGKERRTIYGNIFVVDGNFNPARGNAVSPKTAARPRVGREDHLFWIGIEIRRPPAESAVRNNRMLAKAHQIKFFVIGLTTFDKFRRHVEL